MGASISMAHCYKPFKIACRRQGNRGNLLFLRLPLDNEEPEKIAEIEYETSPEARKAMIIAAPWEDKNRFATYSAEVARVARRLISEYSELREYKKMSMRELREKEYPEIREEIRRRKAARRERDERIGVIKPQTIAFMDLNYDCRRLIYEALFPDAAIGIWARQPDKRWQDPLKTVRFEYPALKVLQLSKAINYEASEVYFGKNFLFVGHRASWVVLDSFLRTIRPQNYRFLRHVTVAYPHDEVHHLELAEKEDRFDLERVEKLTNLAVSDRIWSSKLSDMWDGKRYYDDDDDEDGPQIALGDACDRLAQFPNLRSIDLVYPLHPLYTWGGVDDKHALRQLQDKLPQIRFRIVVLHDTRKDRNCKEALYDEKYHWGEEASLFNIAVNIAEFNEVMGKKTRLAWALDEAPQKWEVHEDRLKRVLAMHKGYGDGPAEEEWDGRSWASPSRVWVDDLDGES